MNASVDFVVCRGGFSREMLSRHLDRKCVAHVFDGWQTITAGTAVYMSVQTMEDAEMVASFCAQLPAGTVSGLEVYPRIRDLSNQFAELQAK